MNPNQLLFHCSLTTVSRRKGQFATRKAAYNSGDLLRDDRTGQTFDFRFKPVLHRALIVGGSIALSGINRAELWNRVEIRERRWDSRLAREFKVSLPCMLGEEKNLTLLERFALFLSDELCTPVDLALHPPSKRGDKRNIHGHLLFPSRFWEDGSFGAKHRDLDNRFASGALVTKFRKEFAQLTNKALLEAGEPFFVDHRSYAAQGISKQPDKHLGPKRWWVMQRILEELHALEAEEMDLLREETELQALTTTDIERATAELHEWATYFRGEGHAPDPCAFRIATDRRLDLSPGFATLIDNTDHVVGLGAPKRSDAEEDRAAILRSLLSEFLELVRQALLMLNSPHREEEKEKERDMASMPSL
jgi:hypothetical protein